MKIDFFQISLNFRIIFFSYFYVKIYIKWRKIDIQKKIKYVLRSWDNVLLIKTHKKDIKEG